MKKVCVLMTAVLLLFLTGCQKDEIGLAISTDKVHRLNSDEHILKMRVRSDSPWTAIVEGDEHWCSISSLTEDSLIIHISVNLQENERNNRIIIGNAEEGTDIQIQQAAATGEYHYRLPVVFHILHRSGEEVVEQDVADRLIMLLGEANRFYGGAGGTSVDMNVEFVLATHDPDGKPLTQPGINYMEHGQSTMTPQDFGDNKYGDADRLWDPNKYINVFLFTFIQPSILGFAFVPFTPSQHALEGLPVNDIYYYAGYMKDYVPSVSLNRKFLDTIQPNPNGGLDLMRKTFIHEMGHFLGLLHAFGGEDYEELELSDFCDDTPDYNRNEYMYWQTMHPKATYEERLQRTDRRGNSYVATNMMDYAECLFTQFTPDQRKRVRHVLTYSPFIPGPKICIDFLPASKGGREDKPVFIE